MSELTRKQARLVKSQIKKLYGRSYIPLITGDSTLTVGDVLNSKYDIVPVVDSSVFSEGEVEFTEGKKINRNITSSSGVNISTKFEGEATLSEYFKLEEAGVAVEFTSNHQMFLKILGARQQSITNFVDFRNELLSRYIRGDLSSKVYVVRGLVYADAFYLQYSGSNGGSIGFNLSAEANQHDAEVNADFSLKWKKEVGYHIDGSNGGVLAYRVSSVRLKRHLVPSSIQKRILKGFSEEDVLDNLSFTERNSLIESDALEVVDLTDEVLLAHSGADE